MQRSQLMGRVVSTVVKTSFTAILEIATTIERLMFTSFSHSRSAMKLSNWSRVVSPSLCRDTVVTAVSRWFPGLAYNYSDGNVSIIY